MIKTFLLMALVVQMKALLLGSTSWPLSPNEEESTTAGHDKDLYVIHAMVYEVGILNNSTNDTSENDNNGEQVALTVYHKNGTDIDFSKIHPLYTNITGESLTGLVQSPIHQTKRSIPLSAQFETSMDIETLKKRQNYDDDTDDLENTTDTSEEETSTYHPESEEYHDYLYRRSTDHNVNTLKKTLKRSLVKEEEYAPKPTETYGRIEKDDGKYWSIARDVVAVPPETAINSIALPSLISLNANLSKIPVPIPNTSVVSYSSVSAHTKPADDTEKV